VAADATGRGRHTVHGLGQLIPCEVKVIDRLISVFVWLRAAQLEIC
jgi:hypothetical protein